MHKHLTAAFPPILAKAVSHLTAKLSRLKGVSQVTAFAALDAYQLCAIRFSHEMVETALSVIPESLFGELEFSRWWSNTSGSIWSGVKLLSDMAKRFIPGLVEGEGDPSGQLAFASQDEGTKQKRWAADIAIHNAVDSGLSSLQKRLNAWRVGRALRWATEVLRSPRETVDELDDSNWQHLFDRLEGLWGTLNQIEDMQKKAQVPKHLRDTLDLGLKAGRASDEAELHILAVKRLMETERLKPYDSREKRLIFLHETSESIPKAIRMAEAALFEHLEKASVVEPPAALSTLQSSRPDQLSPENTGKLIKGSKEICRTLGLEPSAWRWLRQVSEATDGPLHGGKAGRGLAVFEDKLKAWFQPALDSWNTGRPTAKIGKERDAGTSAAPRKRVTDESGHGSYQVKVRRSDRGKKRKPKQP